MSRRAATMCIALLGIALLLPTVLLAQTPAKYRPYPDVWVCELATNRLHPARLEYTSIIQDLFLLPNGDYLIWYVAKEYPDHFDYEGVTFFSGEKLKSVPSDAKKVDFARSLSFQDGITITLGDLCKDYDLNPQRCYQYLYPIFYITRLSENPVNSPHVSDVTRKADTNPLTKKYLVYERPEPFEVASYAYCGNQSGKCYTTFEYVYPKMVKLTDGTFLVAGGNFVIRLDNNLKPKFKTRAIHLIDLASAHQYDSRLKK